MKHTKDEFEKADEDRRKYYLFLKEQLAKDVIGFAVFTKKIFNAADSGELITDKLSEAELVWFHRMAAFGAQELLAKTLGRP